MSYTGFASHLLGLSPCTQSADLQKLGFQLLLLNGRLVCKKASLISHLITDERANLACIIETWLGLEGELAFGEKFPAGFQIWHQLRLQGRDGYVVIVIREETFASATPKVPGCVILGITQDCAIAQAFLLHMAGS